MLKKLMKYDMKANLFPLGLTYIILLGYGVFNRLLAVLVKSDYRAAFSFVFSSVGFFFAVLAAVVITIIFIILRFYRNMMGNEGYLSHTLPVTPFQHVMSKTISGVLWLFIMSTVIYLSVWIWGGSMPSKIGFYFDFASLARSIIAGMEPYRAVIEVINLLVSPLLMVVTFYFSICLGHLVPKMRVFGAILFYIAIALVKAALTTTLGIMLIMMKLDYSTMTVVTLVMNLVVNIGCLIGFFWGSCLIMKRKLNLE